MKILHTEWSDDLGGQEKRILAEATGLIDRGHYVALICREHAKIRKEAEHCGIKVYTLPLRKPYDIASIIRLVKLMEAERFDVVNTHSGIDSWIGGIAAKIAGVPVLVRTRHLNIPLKRSLFNFIHYLPDTYITCGENMRETLVNKCGFPQDRVVSIPTGVDSVFFDVKRNPAAKLKYGLDKDSIVVSNVGILRSVKGQEITLNAVKAVLEVFPKAKFLIVGDGPARERLENTAATLGISDNVIFTGFLGDIPEIYSFTDIAVLSSWSEGLPQSILQAMASGVPVVATKVGGVPEVVIDGKTGITVAHGDSKALAESIIRILSSPSMAGDFTRNARTLVMERHSNAHMLNKIETLYKSLLKQNG